MKHQEKYLIATGCNSCKSESFGLGPNRIENESFSIDSLFPKTSQVDVPTKESESSGGSCSYYEAEVYSPALDQTQTVECKDVMHALGLTHAEINIFKEVWRSAAARKGKQKKGHTQVRGAEKIKFFADENLLLVKAGK
tara:strand:+ start:220 stop:636 length:417 start_codon:yes stop_codon:yes gene_type:complete